jgi:hypothetical protein
LAAVGATPVTGWGESNWAFAVAGAERGAGSAVMMLTGGIEAALGKSALVGRPVVPGMGCGKAATVAGAAGKGCGAAAASVAPGAFHSGA